MPTDRSLWRFALTVVALLSFPLGARAQGVETIIEWNRRRTPHGPR